MNLFLSNIDMEEKLINIRNTEVHKLKFLIERQIPMCPNLVDLLKDIDRYKSSKGIESPFLICDENGSKIADERPTKEIHRIVLSGGLRDGVSFQWISEDMRNDAQGAKHTETGNPGGSWSQE